MADDWDRLIGRAATSCGGCDESFADEAEVVTQLLVGEAGFARRDVCDVCAHTGEPPAGLFSFWRAKRGAPAPTSRRLDLSYMLELFLRLADQKSERGRDLAWIVTLLLLRKKILELTGRAVTPDGAECLSVRIKKEERVFLVVDPRLSAEQLAALGEDLGRIFDLEPAARSEGGNLAKRSVTE